VTLDPLGGGFFGTIFAIAFLVTVVLIVLIFGLVFWTFRRAIPRDDAAVTELKARSARGEIDTAEYQARLDELTRGR